MKNSFKLFFWGLVFILSFTMSCNKSENFDPSQNQLKDIHNDVYKEWIQVFLELDQYASFFRPGPAPRALAYMGLSAYEACLGGMTEYNSLQHRLGIRNMPPVRYDLYWPEVINASYGSLMYKFFETVTFKDRNGAVLDKQSFLNKIILKEQELRARFQLESNEIQLTNSESHGREVAASVWLFALTDHVGHDGHLNPFPVAVVAQGCEWVPTDPNTVSDRGLFPQWGKVRSFSLSQSDLDALASPYNTCNSEINSPIYAQAYETYVLTLSAKKEPIGDLEHMAEFWSDDRVGWTFSPPGRMYAIAEQISALERFDLETNCLMYAQLGMALNDAAVIAWYNKYKFNVERPISYIHRHIDPNFSIPWLGFNPPFPAYPSGHSTFAYTGAGILEYFVGSNYYFTDFCHAKRTDFNGKPRSYNTLRDLAYENAFSRLPLGVHYRMDADGGNYCGLLVAKKINALPWKK